MNVNNNGGYLVEKKTCVQTGFFITARMPKTREYPPSYITAPPRTHRHHRHESKVSPTLLPSSSGSSRHYPLMSIHHEERSERLERLERKHKKHKKSSHKSHKRKRVSKEKEKIEVKALRPLVEYDDVSSDTLSEESESPVSSRVTPEKELKKPDRHVSPATAIKAYKQQYVDKGSPSVREKLVGYRHHHHHHRNNFNDEKRTHSQNYESDKYHHLHTARETREPSPVVTVRKKRSRSREPPRAYRNQNERIQSSSSPPARTTKRRPSISPREGRDRRFQSPDRPYIRSPSPLMYSRVKHSLSMSRSRSRSPLAFKKKR